MLNEKYIYITTELRDYIKQSTGLGLQLSRPDMSMLLENNIQYSMYIVDNSISNKYKTYVHKDDEGNIIMYTDVPTTKSKGNNIKLGKLLKCLVPSLDSTEIESIVSLHKKNYTLDISKVQVSKYIDGIYDMSNVGGSCMAYKGEYMQIYIDAKCSIAYITVTDSNNPNRQLLGARALLWHDLEVYDTKGNMLYIVDVMDRIFFTKEHHKLNLEKWASVNGFSLIGKFTDEILATKPDLLCREYEYVPYIDNLFYATEDGRLTNDNDLFDIRDSCRETNGRSTDGYISYGIGEDDVYCEDTGEYVYIDDTYWVEDLEVYYESDYELTHIEGYGYYTADSEDICYAEDTGEHMMKDNCTYIESEDIYVYSPDDYVICYDDGEWYHIVNVTYCEDIQDYVNDSVDTYYVEDLAEYHYNTDNIYEHSDGKWYSEPEEEEDEVA